ncbi:hypothetical protein WICMUC_001127 [Wickerhamomyces mucosus]|uniref:Uncharacterized protein n=1 Tax=Wickerhamomyces mucosus TaxID=1378264 RepID=A0A9P8PVQ6_9ASCO|nr:hypothetical protein WICMUC_001127 [Wickerhamomyces mucosus]
MIFEPTSNAPQAYDYNHSRNMIIHELEKKIKIITLSNNNKASTCFISIFLSKLSIKFSASSNFPLDVNILASCNNQSAECGNSALAYNKQSSNFCPGCNNVGSPIPWKAFDSVFIIFADLVLCNDRLDNSDETDDLLLKSGISKSESVNWKGPS